MKIKKFITTSPIPAIIAAQMELNRSLDRDLAQIELIYIEAMILSTLFFEGETKSSNPSVIARSLFFPLPRVSAALTNLGQKNLIERELVDLDSRRIRIKLTSKGQRKALQAVEIFHKKQLWIESIMGEKSSKDLNTLLLKLRLALSDSNILCHK